MSEVSEKDKTIYAFRDGKIPFFTLASPGDGIYKPLAICGGLVKKTGHNEFALQAWPTQEAAEKAITTYYANEGPLTTKPFSFLDYKEYKERHKQDGVTMRLELHD